MYDISIKKCRHEKHMSQEELSLRSGISASHISQIEQDNSARKKTPTLQALEALAFGLQICPVDLISYDCNNCKLFNNCPRDIKITNNTI